MEQGKINFVDLGVGEYNQVWSEQERLFNISIDIKKRRNVENSTTLPINSLLFVEHPHVYTLGKSGDSENLLLNYIQLQAKDASFVKSDRGGDITYHGPGQIVGYPIFDLEQFNIGLREYIWRLEEAIIATIARFGLVGTRDPKATGVWLDIDRPNCRKICAIGVKSAKFITMHGFALNINTDLTYFQHINPCGFIDKGVTSLSKELGKEVDMSSVKEIIREEIETIFK